MSHNIQLCGQALWAFDQIKQIAPPESIRHMLHLLAAFDEHHYDGSVKKLDSRNIAGKLLRLERSLTPNSPLCIYSVHTRTNCLAKLESAEEYVGAVARRVKCEQVGLLLNFTLYFHPSPDRLTAQNTPCMDIFWVGYRFL